MGAQWEGRKQSVAWPCPTRQALGRLGGGPGLHPGPFALFTLCETPTPSEAQTAALPASLPAKEEGSCQDRKPALWNGSCCPPFLCLIFQIAMTGITKSDQL